jgi:hypothetical protein
MYDEAAAYLENMHGTAVAMPEWDDFTTSKHWRLVPNRTGGILQGVFSVRMFDPLVTLVRRIGNDTEAGARALPANNPWAETIETVVTGWLTERRYLTGPTKVTSTTTYNMGHSRYLRHQAYTLVTEVGEGTLTLLNRRGPIPRWNHIDPDTYLPVSAYKHLPDNFHAMEAQLNQH